MNDSTIDVADDDRKFAPRRLAVVAVVVAAVAGAGWYGFQRYRTEDSSEGEYITAAIASGNIEDLITSTGTLQPRDYVDVGAQVSGQIDKIYVEVGDTVEEGQVLASIDATTSQARVDANRASLRSSESNLIDSQNSLEKAERDYLRQQNLLKDDATTKEAVLNAETALKAARQRIVSQTAQIDQQKANMRIEEKNLNYTKIVAPIAGTVMSIAVKQGQTVNASQNVPNVMRIANLGTMTVQSEVSEADVARLFKGIPVYFTTLGGQTRRWHSELKRIEPTPKVQNSVVLYNALFDVKNEGSSLMPSMTAQVYFVSAEAKQVLIVPMAALQQGPMIARDLAMKEKEKKDAAKPAAEGPQGTAAKATSSNPASASKADASAAPPATNRAATPGDGSNGGAPGGGDLAGAMAAFGIRPEQMEQLQRMRAQAGNGAPGGFNPQSMSPAQQEQLRRMMSQFGGGGAGVPSATGTGGGGTRPPARRNGMVMVKKADGTLESRQVVIGVTDRVFGQVLAGLKEGEEVVVGKREKPSVAGAASQPQGSRSNSFGISGGAGGFPAGGLPAGFRPF